MVIFVFDESFQRQRSIYFIYLVQKIETFHFEIWLKRYFLLISEIEISNLFHYVSIIK